ncbi:MAG: hypothetical protein K2X93_12125 [Candidatus Obscuribacterales bacterium]|nr:hypothetical protein [Candidatus Obscuribacterales bacterium]
MNKSMLSKLSGLYREIGGSHKVDSIDTLVAFVRDNDHEVLSVVTALQAHLDLLHDELLLKNWPVDRFVVLNRAVDRLIADTVKLSSVSQLTQAPRVEQKRTLGSLVEEIAAETQPDFSKSNVSLNCNISQGTTLVQNARAVKLMIKELILAVLHNCKQLETVTLSGSSHKKLVSMACDTGSESNEGKFKRWQLGKLDQIPTNGDGIMLSTVDAIARLNHGHLSVRPSSDHRSEFRLSFQI